MPDPSLKNIPNFCLNCGAPLAPATVRGEERPACRACGWVFYEDPKAAVAVLVVVEGKVLLTRRAIAPGLGKWSLPAGFLNAREDPIVAARRECREETGLDINIGKLLTVLAGREHPRGADLLLVYLATIKGGELIPGDDASSVRFFPLGKLPPLAFRSTRKIIHSFAHPVK